MDAATLREKTIELEKKSRERKAAITILFNLRPRTSMN